MQNMAQFSRLGAVNEVGNTSTEYLSYPTGYKKKANFRHKCKETTN
jgi:hypothetical protein